MTNLARHGTQFLDRDITINDALSKGWVVLVLKIDEQGADLGSVFGICPPKVRENSLFKSSSSLQYLLDR